MRFTILILSLIKLALAQGQGFKMNHSNSVADCYGAAEVTNYSIISTINFPGNAGIFNDFEYLLPNKQEVNSVWIKLKPRVKGEFKLEILNQDSLAGDLSYFIFRDKSNDFCDNFSTKYVKPEEYVASGLLNSKNTANKNSVEFSPIFKTDFEDVFYLLIHSGNKKNSLVSLNYIRTGEIEKTEIVAQDFRKNKDEPYLEIKIRDKDTRAPVTANLAFSGKRNQKALYLGTDFYFGITPRSEIEIYSNTKGYFVYREKFKTDHLENSSLTIELDPLAPGKKLKLHDIMFEMGSASFTSKSLPALKQLLDFLLLNNEIVIEVQGHVNSPNADNTVASQKLSKKRAKAVYNFLKKNGIGKERMETKGYGNTEMINENPKNEEESTINRRVEILILDT